MASYTKYFTDSLQERSITLSLPATVQQPNSTGSKIPSAQSKTNTLNYTPRLFQ